MATGLALAIQAIVKATLCVTLECYIGCYEYWHLSIGEYLSNGSIGKVSGNVNTCLVYALITYSAQLPPQRGGAVLLRAQRILREVS